MTYNRLLAQRDEYKMKVRDIMTRRELLWEQARVCMRCGSAYISKTRPSESIKH